MSLRTHLLALIARVDGEINVARGLLDSLDEILQMEDDEDDEWDNENKGLTLLTIPNDDEDMDSDDDEDTDSDHDDALRCPDCEDPKWDCEFCPLIEDDSDASALDEIDA